MESAVLRRLREDIRCIFERDPAATSTLEVLLCYPGLHAIGIQRLAHRLYRHRMLFLARLLSHIGRFLTGIEIHPGAMIGRRVFIDHGMGVVVGETAQIGDDCLLYQGVVLGGTSTEKKKRHPTLQDNVVVGAGAIVLGDIVIGAGARIGAGSVVIRPVPPGATVVGVPGRVVRTQSGKKFGKLEHGALPDPMAEIIRSLMRDHELVESRMHALEEKLDVPVPPEAHVPTHQVQEYVYCGEGI